MPYNNNVNVITLVVYFNIHMKKISYLMGGTSLLALPMLASAQAAIDPNGSLVNDSITNILTFINNTIIPAIIAIGFLVFVWGMFKFFIAGGSNDDAKESGKSLMIWATLGFVLIIVFWGIVNLLTSSTGLDSQTIQNTPQITPGA
ncbi:MAG: hypothetical protein RLZZ230_303 [Candidatus Parcubacteria bacterium]|jgi:uncharacterized membrane protein YidH (DUF202 family)